MTNLPFRNHRPSLLDLEEASLGLYNKRSVQEIGTGAEELLMECASRIRDLLDDSDGLEKCETVYRVVNFVSNNEDVSTEVVVQCLATILGALMKGDSLLTYPHAMLLKSTLYCLSNHTHCSIQHPDSTRILMDALEELLHSPEPVMCRSSSYKLALRTLRESDSTRIPMDALEELLHSPEPVICRSSSYKLALSDSRPNSDALSSVEDWQSCHSGEEFEIIKSNSGSSSIINTPPLSLESCETRTYTNWHEENSYIGQTFPISSGPAPTVSYLLEEEVKTIAAVVWLQVIINNSDTEAADVVSNKARLHLELVVDKDSPPHEILGISRQLINDLIFRRYPRGN